MSTTTTEAVGTPADRLAGMDFSAHNEAVRATWEAFHAGRPTRVPVILGTNTRYFMFNPGANRRGVTFRDYIEDPDVMFEAALGFQRWSRFNLLQDVELGLPEKWCVSPDFQNFYEAAWFGCAIEYFDDQVPDTTPAFVGCPERVMERGLPDAFGGIMGRALGYYERFKALAQGREYLGRPVHVQAPWCGLGTDGPLTVACNLFGPEFVCSAMVEEPERLRVLLEFITTATIARMTAWRKLATVPVPQDNFGIADDSCALISTEMYVEHVLPHHRRIFDALGTAKGRGIHLCGDATRHFETLRDELGIVAFDTGFPVDFGAVRRRLGPNVKIQGGPHVDLLLRGTPGQVREAVRRVMASGVLDGGQFVLREGNNLAPYTPLENTEAMYRAGLEFGGLGG